MLKYEEKSEYIPGSRATSKKECSCTHAFQNKTYGKGIRVHNKTKDGWRCTACGTAR